MDRIREVSETKGADLLTSTSGGLLDTEYLSGDPPTAYLAEYEQPQYVLRNKKAGLTVAAGPTTEELVPESDHQALAVVTDCQVVVLVGQTGGDSVKSVPLDEIVEADVESSGFLKSALTLETIDGEVWRFPVRGDASDVATALDDAAQTWANARRLTDEASEQIEASREHLDAGKFGAARQVLSDVATKMETATERVSTVGSGATQALSEKTGLLLDRLRQLEQEIAATKGAHHHATAQDAWKRNHDFERAAEEYEHAVEEYERALAADGNVPTDEALQARLRGVVKEREVLRVAPMADARAAREVAMAAEDADEAAAEWETALTCYREAVTLDWGKEDRTFITDRETAEKRAVEATENALDAHSKAGEEWLAAGDRIVRNDSKEQANQAYERAEEHLTRGREIAAELAPEQVDAFEQRLSQLRKRKAGEVLPPEGTDESTLAVADIATESAADTGNGDETVPSTDAAESEPPSDGPEAERPKQSDPTPAIRRAERESGPVGDEGPRSGTEPEDEATPIADVSSVDAADSEASRESAEDEPQAPENAVVSNTEESEIGETAAGGSDTGEDAAEESNTEVAKTNVLENSEIDPYPEEDPGRTAGTEPEAEEAESLSDGNESTATTRAKSNNGPATEGAGTEDRIETESPDGISVDVLVERLRALDEAELTEFVAELWEQRGWSTTVFSSTTKAVYDVVAMAEDGEERLLLWTVHRPDGGTLTETVLRRCATTRDSSQGADSATLVTTGSLTSATRERAESLDVTVLDCEQLAEAVQEAGLQHELPE